MTDQVQHRLGDAEGYIVEILTRGNRILYYTDNNCSLGTPKAHEATIFDFNQAMQRAYSLRSMIEEKKRQVSFEDYYPDVPPGHENDPKEVNLLRVTMSFSRVDLPMEDDL